MQSRLRLVRTILGARDSICPMHRQLSASIWTRLFLSVAIKAWSSGNSRFRGSPWIKPIGKLSPKILWAVGDKPKAPPHPEGSWNLLGGRVRIIKPFWWAGDTSHGQYYSFSEVDLGNVGSRLILLGIWVVAQTSPRMPKVQATTLV